MNSGQSRSGGDPFTPPSGLGSNARFWPVALGFTFFLMIPANPLGGGITTTRLAIVILLLLATMRLTLRERKFPYLTLLPLFGGSVACVVFLFSFVMNGGSGWVVFSWVLLGLLATLLAYCTVYWQREWTDLFVTTVIALTLLLWVVVLGWMARSGVIGVHGAASRRLFDAAFVSDLNRVMNAMFVYASIAMATVYCGLVKRRIIELAAVVVVGVSLVVFLFLGTRQNVVALFVFMVLLVVLNHTEAAGKHWTGQSLSSVVFLLIGAFGGLMVAIQVGWLDPTFLETRFVQTLIAGELTTGDQTRLWVAGEALNAAVIDGGLGLGPGMFDETFHRYPHNGYLGFLAEAGWWMGGIGLLAIAFTIVYCWLRRGHGAPPLSHAAWALFFTVAFVLVNVKDLLREPIFWSLLGLAVGLSITGPGRLTTAVRARVRPRV